MYLSQDFKKTRIRGKWLKFGTYSFDRGSSKGWKILKKLVKWGLIKPQCGLVSSYFLSVSLLQDTQDTPYTGENGETG